MRKAVAVPYVIALILGVAVIALIGIWFVMSGGKFTTQSLETSCQSKAVQSCSQKLSGSAELPSECSSIASKITTRCNVLLGTCKPKDASCDTTKSDECCSATCSGTPSKCS